MYRLAATVIFSTVSFSTGSLSSVAFAQTSHEREIAFAAKSPLGLARYVESHAEVDWKAVRSALHLQESEYWFAPCGGDAPANETRCSAETVTVANPSQTIVIIRGGEFSFTDEYLRYLQGPNRDWKFAGEKSAEKRFGLSNHALVRLGTKPLLKISGNHSQNGMSVQQEVEDWFDLTLADFEPVFSFTSVGRAGGLGFTLSRDIKAKSSFSQAGQVERIETTLNVRFGGTAGLDAQGTYIGIFERHANEKKFTLRIVYSGLDRHATIPTKDFEDLANPFTDPAKETFIRYALPGLKKIAAGSNADDREWLRDFLAHSKDTEEKQMLLEILARR